MQGLATQRGTAYASRASAQRAEEAALTDEAARAALAALSQRADPAAVRAAADAALGAAEAAVLGRALPVVLDEFGRDENMAARMALKQRCVVGQVCSERPRHICAVVAGWPGSGRQRMRCQRAWRQRRAWGKTRTRARAR